MADALTVQSYYESILQANGIDYAFIQIPRNTTVTNPSSITKFYTYAFENTVSTCMLFLSHYYQPAQNATWTSAVIQYIPLEYTPTDKYAGSYVGSITNYPVYTKQWAVFRNNSLEFYACNSAGGSGYNIGDIDIGSVVALVTY